MNKTKRFLLSSESPCHPSSHPISRLFKSSSFPLVIYAVPIFLPVQSSNLHRFSSSVVIQSSLHFLLCSNPFFSTISPVQACNRSYIFSSAVVLSCFINLSKSTSPWLHLLRSRWSMLGVSPMSLPTDHCQDMVRFTARVRLGLGLELG